VKGKRPKEAIETKKKQSRQKRRSLPVCVRASCQLNQSSTHDCLVFYRPDAVFSVATAFRPLASLYKWHHGIIPTGTFGIIMSKNRYIPPSLPLKTSLTTVLLFAMR
jgi:hypothetical protein